MSRKLKMDKPSPSIKGPSPPSVMGVFQPHNFYQHFLCTPWPPPHPTRPTYTDVFNQLNTSLTPCRSVVLRNIVDFAQRTLSKYIHENICPEFVERFSLEFSRPPCRTDIRMRHRIDEYRYLAAFEKSGLHYAIGFDATQRNVEILATDHNDLARLIYDYLGERLFHEYNPTPRRY